MGIAPDGYNSLLWRKKFSFCLLIVEALLGDILLVELLLGEVIRGADGGVKLSLVFCAILFTGNESLGRCEALGRRRLGSLAGMLGGDTGGVGDGFSTNSGANLTCLSFDDAWIISESESDLEDENKDNSLYISSFDVACIISDSESPFDLRWSLNSSVPQSDLSSFQSCLLSFIMSLSSFIFNVMIKLIKIL